MDPLDKPGDLSIFGASEKPTLPADEMPENEVVELREEEPSLILPVEEETEEEQTEPEPSLLQAALAEKKRDEESENTRLRQELAEMRGELKGRLEAAEQQIRQSTPVTEPEPEESIWKTPAVKGMLREIQEEDPDKVLPAAMSVMEKQLEEKLTEYRAEVQKTLETEKAKLQSDKLAEQMIGSVHQVLAKIKSEGGVSAEIVDDFYTRRNESFLGKRLSQNRNIVLAGEDGLRGAVVGIEAELRRQPQQSTPASVEPVSQESAGSGGASTRGVQLGEKPNKKTPEEQIADDMMNVGKRTSKIPFL